MTELRTRQIMIRVTAKQHAAWVAAAVAEKRTLADWVRVRIKERIEKAAK